jgi:integrase
MSLTNTAIKNARPSDKTARLFDGGGLYLEVAPSGGKWWRLKYRFEGKEKRLSLGVYPDVGLREARERRDEARKLLADGVDPGENRKAAKAAKTTLLANSFEVIAREWLAKMKSEWADSHYIKVVLRLENDVFPWIGSKPITEVTAPVLLTVARRVLDRGIADTPHRILQSCGQIFRYAIATGRAERNPVPDLRGALPSPQRKNFPSITDPVKVGELLRAIEGHRGTLAVNCALRLAPLVFCRPGELRMAKWEDIDLERGIWDYFVTKVKAEHLVPLSRQAVAILKEIQPLTGHGKYVFPGARDHTKPMSPAAINAALRRMGYDTKTEITGHGFRAMARTILHERLKVPENFIERQLSHKASGPLGTAYDRAKYIDDRIPMMQTWADYLDELKAGAKVIPLHGSVA